MGNAVNSLVNGKVSEFSETIKDALLGKAHEAIQSRRQEVAQSFFSAEEEAENEEV